MIPNDFAANSGCGLNDQLQKELDFLSADARPPTKNHPKNKQKMVRERGEHHSSDPMFGGSA
jgi:hypothetical protein